MKTYVDKAVAPTKWKTALIVVQDEDGTVYVDRSIRHFKDQIAHEATPAETLYILAEARRQFEVEQTARIVAVELNRLLKQKAG